MNIEIILVVAIIIFAGISIVLGIFNLLSLSSTSLKISNLEESVEKKTKEFDTLKKERQSIASQSYTDPSEKQNSSFGPAEPALNSESQHPSIEIVRSYPTGFKTVEFEKIQNPEEVPDVSHQNNTQEWRNPLANDSIEIALFSETKKDTDFVSAWKDLTAHLSVTSNPQVVINFRNVMFLYEKELMYLEKIQEVVAKAHGSMKFIDYHRELREILSTRPALAHFCKE